MYLPTTQQHVPTEHELWFPKGCDLPCGQTAQAADPTPENEPGLQALHAAKPVLGAV